MSFKGVTKDELKKALKSTAASLKDSAKNSAKKAYGIGAFTANAMPRIIFLGILIFSMIRFNLLKPLIYIFGRPMGSSGNSFAYSIINIIFGKTLEPNFIIILSFIVWIFALLIIFGGLSIISGVFTREQIAKILRSSFTFFLIIFLIVGIWGYFVSSDLTIQEQLENAKQNQGVNSLSYQFKEIKCSLFNPINARECLAKLEKERLEQAGISTGSKMNVDFEVFDIVKSKEYLTSKFNNTDVAFKYDIESNANLVLDKLECHEKKSSGKIFYRKNLTDKKIIKDMTTPLLLKCNLKDLAYDNEKDNEIIKIVPTISYKAIDTKVTIPIPILDKSKYIEEKGIILTNNPNDRESYKILDEDIFRKTAYEYMGKKGGIKIDQDSATVIVKYKDFTNYLPIIVNKKKESEVKNSEPIDITLIFEKSLNNAFGELENIKDLRIVSTSEYYNIEKIKDSEEIIRNNDGKITGMIVELRLTPNIKKKLETDYVKTSIDIIFTTEFKYGSTSKNGISLNVKNDKKAIEEKKLKEENKKLYDELVEKKGDLKKSDLDNVNLLIKYYKFDSDERKVLNEMKKFIEALPEEIKKEETVDTTNEKTTESSSGNKN